MNYETLLTRFFQREVITEYSLDAIGKVCEYFGHPESAFSVIHIGGTNGKGSVSRMTFQILKDAGKKVGIFTSPHLVDICERFETESGQMTRDEFIYYAEIILAYPGKLSYFEKCTLMAFLFFRDKNSEYAVIEVGVGGRLDATNVVKPIITTITSIGYDHMELLGNTLEAIAHEKGGIIKPHIPIVLAEGNAVLEEKAHAQESPIIFASRRDIPTNLLGAHQRANASIAYEIGRFLGIPEEKIRTSLLRVVHHGRLEYIRKNLLIDGAHNIDGLQALRDYLGGEQWKNIHYFVALKAGKSIDLLTKVFSEVHIWGVIKHDSVMTVTEDMLIAEFRGQGHEAEIFSPDTIRESAEKNPDTLHVVFGSLYVLGVFLSPSV